MKVLIIGSGGREHALAWKLSQSPEVTKMYCAPGNPGIASVAECVQIPASDQRELLKFAEANDIDLTVVGPEDPLVGGIVDRFQKKGRRIFGPSERGAQLEGSKQYAKEICLKHSIPTGKYRAFRDYELAMQHLRGTEGPMVVKADGLAAGKGVFICANVAEAMEAVNTMMRQSAFGAAGSRVVIEEFLKGQELSMLAITDGHTIVPFEPAQDHKAIFDGDKGPNTGGMGTYSPLSQFTRDQVAEVERDVLVQTIHGMNREGVEFRGCLFIGLMMTEDGPRVLEYNVRFGDPETQTLMRRMKSDLFPLLWHTTTGTLDQCSIDWDPRPAVTVVLASGGYPGKVNPPTRIHGLDGEFGPDVVVFHAGTKKSNGAWQTNGGRVLNVTAVGDSLQDARAKAYAACAKIEFAGKQMRTDIGFRAL
jgi:phosphoribosylamine--glycine ligase